MTVPWTDITNSGFHVPTSFIISTICVKLTLHRQLVCEDPRANGIKKCPRNKHCFCLLFAILTLLGAVYLGNYTIQIPSQNHPKHLSWRTNVAKLSILDVCEVLATTLLDAIFTSPKIIFWSFIWIKVVKNGLSKICGQQPLKIWRGMVGYKQTILLL